jgi:hypothetical protein
MSHRAVVAALVVLAAGWAVTFWLGPWSDEQVSDLFVYRQVAAPILDGGLPYRDVFFEYPPLAGGVIALPGLIGTGEVVYRLAFAGLMLGSAAVVVLLCGALAARTGGEPRRAMLAASAAPLLTGAMIRTHFDLAPVALTLGALLLLCARRPRLGLAVLGLGVMTKGFPLVAAPPALAWLIARGERRAAVQGGLALVLVVGILGGAAVAASPAGALDAVRYHVERPVQVESAPAVALSALDGLDAGNAESVKSHRSDGLNHPAASAVTAGFGAVLLGILGLITGAVGKGDPSDRRLVLASLAGIAAFAALGKVLSPQFLIWLVPLGALAAAWRMRALALGCAGAIALTLVEFPSHYFDLVAREPFALTLVATRDALLIAVVVLAVRGLFASLEARAPRAAVARGSL